MEKSWVSNQTQNDNFNVTSVSTNLPNLDWTLCSGRTICPFLGDSVATHTLWVDQSHEFVIQELIHLCILMFAISASHILPPQTQIFLINRTCNFRRRPATTHNHKKSEAHRKQQLLCDKIVIMRIRSHQVWQLPSRCRLGVSGSYRLGLATCGIGSQEEPANGASFQDLRVHPFQ